MPSSSLRSRLVLRRGGSAVRADGRAPRRFVLDLWQRAQTDCDLSAPSPVSLVQRNTALSAFPPNKACPWWRGRSKRRSFAETGVPAAGTTDSEKRGVHRRRQESSLGRPKGQLRRLRWLSEPPSVPLCARDVRMPRQTGRVPGRSIPRRGRSCASCLPHVRQHGGSPSHGGPRPGSKR